MCPSVPMPSSWRSTPPASLSARSYASQAACTSAAVPSGPMKASSPSPSGSTTSRSTTERYDSGCPAGSPTYSSSWQMRARETSTPPLRTVPASAS